MRTFILAGLLIVVLSAYPAMADIYKYRDDQGVIRYTYDLAEVPEDQRPQVQTYEEVAPAPEPAPPEETKNSGDEGDKAEGSAEEPPTVDEKKIEELNQKKKELDEEFAGLMEEKYKLKKEKEKLANSLAGRDQKAVDEYDNKVRELNKKIAEYKKKHSAFQKEADEVKKAAENSGS